MLQIFFTILVIHILNVHSNPSTCPSPTFTPSISVMISLTGTPLPTTTPSFRPTISPIQHSSLQPSINHTAMIIGIVISCLVLFIAYIYIKQKKEKLSKYEFSEDDELMIDL